eukprot:PITA_07306
MAEGGLQVHDPGYENVALGCKFLWQLCVEPNHPISQNLKKKYLKKRSIMNYKPEKHLKGTQAWKLCAKGIEFFISQLYRNSVHIDEEDIWGWGKNGVYRENQGYHQLQSKQDSPHQGIVWKQIWDSFSIPKINFFFWTLFHNKILTGENLCKRGIIGPHRCILCKRGLETTNHMFIMCDFTKEVWSIFFSGLNVSAPSQSTIVSMLTSWNDSYPHQIVNKSILHKVWTTAPKYVCWKIWLAWNETIFNNIELPAVKVVEQEKKLLLETLNHHTAKEDNSLRREESAWLEDYTGKERHQAIN